MSGLLLCYAFNRNYYQKLPCRCIAAYTNLSHSAIIGDATFLEGSDHVLNHRQRFITCSFFINFRRPILFSQPCSRQVSIFFFFFIKKWEKNIFIPQSSDPSSPVLWDVVDSGDKDCRDSAAKAVSQKYLRCLNLHFVVKIRKQSKTNFIQVPLNEMSVANILFAFLFLVSSY